ncbi:cryptochrome/photolyase family protein [Corynebacterium comes]|uniref:Deoxyribodipyrimidine photo-lyase n=1 Tax=Corynebacterium comes TaxID=2675218 RepID=A0A6B8VDV0_9CORY|nr:deoxyribodipyrimidine photo-lyase [Corynebacterium comes]QGU03412.1 Deoxyribodipyrimidine photo-lyase [Corynebacterium comes]
MNEKAPALFWFRDDLRIRHNEALAAAAARGPVIAVHVAEDPDTTGVRPLGGAARWWLHQSLSRLIGSLAEHGIPLMVLRGDPRRLIPELARRTGATYVSWSRRYHRPQRDLDAEVKELLRAAGVEAHSFPGHLLAEPWTIATGQGNPYKVYTPFSRTLRGVVQGDIGSGQVHLEKIPGNLHGPGAAPESSLAELESLALLPSHPSRREPDWTRGLDEAWEPGEEGAWRRLEAFLDSLTHGVGKQGYAEGRDFPAMAVTSRLSPHLRFGEISPQAVWSAAAALQDDAPDVTVFHNELIWRDFAWHRLYHRPDLATVNVRANFDAFPWSWDAGELAASTAGGRDGRRSIRAAEPRDFHTDLSAWRCGTTGIPLVDAGMRELWATGHMHNRVRMVVGSLLTKNLGIHWRHGEEWFWDTLVDADPASNAFNWQWVAGCGDDAAPYFRIFNPVTQAKRFDPDNTYISTWVPEHGGSGYPASIVDLRESRATALAAYEGIRQ